MIRRYAALLPLLCATTCLLWTTTALAQESQWTSEDISLSTPTGTLAGTLTLPRKQSGFPLAVIIAGSGPTDRNGNTVGAATGPASLRLLAEGLAQRGIASVRYDKRGIGASRSAGMRESDLRFEMLADDAAAWVKKYRTDSRFTTITIVGHSEGSLLGMLAAQRAPVDAYVSVAGPARRADIVLHEQLATALPSAMLAESDSVLARLVGGDTVSRTPKGLDALFRPSVQPYLISWFRYTGTIEIAKLGVSVLIAQGTNDFQVRPAEAAALASAAPRAVIVTVVGMNHVLKISPAERAQQLQQSYVDPSIPIAPQFLDAVVTFIQRAKPRRS